MRCRITKAIIDRTPVPPEKPLILFDTDLPGFVLKISPKGRRTFQLRYRMGGRDTPKKTFTIGRFGPLTPEQARRQAQILLGDIRRGVDPAAEKAHRIAEERGAATVADVAADFMTLHVKAKRRTRTFAEYERLVSRLILPAFGTRPIKNLTTAEIERWHHGQRSTPYQANRALAVLASLVSWASQRGHLERNPAVAVERYPEIARRRYLSPAEIGRLGHALRESVADGSLSPHVAAFFRLLLLTGMRKDELRLLTWDRVDLDRRQLVLGELDSKTGSRCVPLSAPAVEVLTNLPPIGGNPYVFPGHLPGRPIVNVNKPWARVIARAGIEARIHDLRHSAASIAVAAGASLPLIGGVLGHKSQATTARYAHLSDDPVRATAEAIGDRAAAALDGATADVVPMRRG
jgi:integrase